MAANRKVALAGLAAVFCVAILVVDSFGGGDDSGDEALLTAAICPIVYRLDETPGARGYHYAFFGNGFFINDQGYLLTVAHVLETFRNGGQPSIWVTRRMTLRFFAPLRTPFPAIIASRSCPWLRMPPFPARPC